MAGFYPQPSVDTFAVFAILCFRRVVRNRTFQITGVGLILFLLWTATHHRAISGDSYTLCVAVFTAPSQESAARRQAARQTWLSLDDGVKHFFFIGSENLHPDISGALAAEEKEGDIVLLPFVDSYNNLTLKLLHSVRYLAERCDCKYILKADDDTFARVDLIVSELEVVKVERRLYWGYFTGKAPVFRRGTWAEPHWFLCDKYLPYARGGGYVFSQRIAKYIADNSEILQRYVSEDVSFGAWTAGLQLHRVHDPRFDTEFKSRGCLNSYLVTHKQSQDQLFEKMDNIRRKGRLCAEGEERETRRAYSYNWTVLPSKCCEPT